MRRNLIICFLLTAATLAAYGQVTRFDFVRYDDQDYVTENRTVQAGMSADGFVWAFKTGHAANYHPLTWLSHMMDCSLYRNRPGGHHLTNLLLHCLNTLLLFGVLRSMTRVVWPSALVGALFALHPLHVESVAWVSERKDLLSTLMGLLAMSAYLAYVRRGGLKWYVLTACCLALGLMAKPMLVTLPLVFVLLDYWPLDRVRSRWRSIMFLIVEKIPLLVLSAVSSAVTYIVQQRGGVVASIEQIPLTLRAANAAVSYVRYLAKMIWPADLAVFYPHPNLAASIPWAGWQVVGAVALLLAISGLVILGARRRYPVVGWLWYLGTLVPVIGLVHVGDAAMADRYSYLPLTGLFIIIAWGGADLIAAVRRRGTAPGAAVASAIVLAACMAITRSQARHWRDSVALFQRAAEVSPYHPKMQNNLGSLFLEAGQYDRAIGHYRQALRIAPNFGKPYHNLGSVYYFQGRIDEAITNFRQALRIKPDFAPAHYYLAKALGAQGRAAEAIGHLREAVRLRTQWPQALNDLAWALATHPEPAIRDAAAAVEYAERASNLTGNQNPQILDTLAAAYAAAGRFDRAVHSAKTALERADATGIEEPLTDGIRKRLQLYRRAEPYRQPAREPGDPPP